ncbi:MAG TPA: prepilin peptidase [Aeromonadales bacterium]|nr:prepilin peptidase [Aeromonadales bacterium]
MEIYQYLISNSFFFLSTVFLFSLLVGSFLNVVICRLPIMLKREWKSDCLGFLAEELEDKELQTKYSNTEDKTPFNLSVPRSRCPSCGHQISALENIPVISWLFLRGKCSQCGAAISIRYPLIELTTALLSVLVAWNFGVQWFSLAAIILTWALIVLTVIDFDTQLLPDNITLPFLWLGILLSLTGISPISLTDSVIGAIAGYMVLWTVYQLFKLVTGKEGMGFGDFKLLALLGAWLGWQALPMILLLSALVGSIVGISLILLLGRDKNIPIPFGPYLAAAGFIALLWGDQIKQAYFTYMGL